jgi:hypothetical protein
MTRREQRRTLLQVLNSYKESRQAVLISVGDQTRMAGTVTRIDVDCVEIYSKDEDTLLMPARIIPFQAIKFIAPYKAK